MTINNSTGCIDTSNVIIINTFYESESFSISLLGDTVYCQGEPLNNSLSINPEISQPTLPPFWTFEVYNDSTYTGNSLNSISGNGDYWVIITNPVGCVFFTDTVTINIDTLSLPTDSITLDSNAHPNNIYCISDLINLVNHDYPNPSEEHYLSVNGISEGIIFDNNNIYSHKLDYTRWNRLVVISIHENGCIDTLFDHSVYVVPSECCNSLNSYELLYGRLDNAINYDGSYLVVDDILTDKGLSYEISEGRFAFMGVATHYLEGFGGIATGPNIYLEDSSRLRGVLTSMFGFCDTMWGGIYVDTAGSIDFDYSLIQDSYSGIKPNADVSSTPNSTLTYRFNGNNNTFLNNYISLTYYANSYVYTPRDGIISGTFSCEPEDMLFPYDLVSNEEQHSYSYKAIDVYEGNSYSTNIHLELSYDSALLDNSFDFIIENHVYGIYMNPSAQFDTVGNAHIENPLVAGYYTDENANYLTIGYDSINMTTQVPSDFTWQQTEEYENNEHLNGRKYAVYSISRNLTVEHSRIFGDGLSLDENNDFDQVYGISNNEDDSVLSNIIEKLDVAIEAREGTTDLVFLDNIMDQNVKGLKFASGADIRLDLNCNQFTKDTLIALTQYGIYVESGAEILNDIGGDGTFVSPAGNGWPVDPSSTGYPSTTNGSGGIPDVYKWDWPLNWYSIYDNNAATDSSQLGYNYYTYLNEFFGEAEKKIDWHLDAVYPSELIIRTIISDTASPTCVNVPSIVYPQSRINSIFRQNLNGNEEFRILPNPAYRNLKIIFPADFEKTVNIRITSLEGKLVLQKNNILSQSNEILLNDSLNGFYLVTILSQKGNVLKRSKLIIN